MMKSKGNILRELFIYIISISLISCSFNQQKVYLKKIEGSPAYEDSYLQIKEIIRGTYITLDNEYEKLHLFFLFVIFYI